VTGPAGRATIAAMVPSGRELPVGVFLGLAVIAAARAIDLVVQGIWTLLVVAGLGPDRGLTAPLVLYAALILVGITAKVLLLVAVIRRPERQRWLYGSWGPAIALAVLLVASVPAHGAMSALQTMHHFEHASVESFGRWTYATSFFSAIAGWINMGVMAGMLLWALARARIGGPPVGAGDPGAVAR